MRWAFILPVSLIGLSGQAVAAETITYSYDALGRLIKVISSGSSAGNAQTDYTFDAAGNRKKVKIVKN